MEIIGYSNPNNFFPSPVIAYVRESRGYYAVFPSGRAVEVDDLKTIENIIPHFVFLKRQKEIKIGEYAFGVDANEILVGIPSAIYKHLSALLCSGRLAPEQKNLIDEYLRSSESDKVPTWKSFAEFVGNFGKMRFLVTKRKVVRNNVEKRGVAERVIVQLKSNSGYKSCYRKNLFFEQSYKNTPIKSKYISGFLPKDAVLVA